MVGATGFLDGRPCCRTWRRIRVPPFPRPVGRLVRQNGIIVVGLSSLLILLWTHGSVDVLVVLYSINVFSRSACRCSGCTYWWHHRSQQGWFKHFFLSALGLSVTATVLVITLIEKFTRAAGSRCSDERGDRVVLHDQPPLRLYARAAREGGRIARQAARSRRAAPGKPDRLSRRPCCWSASIAAQHARAAVGQPAVSRALPQRDLPRGRRSRREGVRRSRTHSSGGTRSPKRSITMSRTAAATASRPTPDRVRHESRRRVHEPGFVDARRIPERRASRAS